MLPAVRLQVVLPAAQPVAQVAALVLAVVQLVQVVQRCCLSPLHFNRCLRALACRLRKAQRIRQ